MRLWTAIAKSNGYGAFVAERARFQVGPISGQPDLCDCRYFNLETGEIVQGHYLALLKWLRLDGVGAGQAIWQPWEPANAWTGPEHAQA